MKHLKKYNKLFENKLENEVDISELLEYLIDFRQMGLDCKFTFGTSYIPDFTKLGYRISQCYLSSEQISGLSKGVTDNSLNIDLSLINSGRISQEISYNINEFEYAYNMVCDYLNYEYELVPNYIYITNEWSYLYFENVDAVRTWAFGGKYKGINFAGQPKFKSGEFKAHRVTFGFYKKDA